MSRQIMTGYSTVPVDVLERRIAALENQVAVLRRAFAVLAAAVTDEEITRAARQMESLLDHVA